MCFIGFFLGMIKSSVHDFYTIFIKKERDKMSVMG